MAGMLRLWVGAFALASVMAVSVARDAQPAITVTTSLATSTSSGSLLPGCSGQEYVQPFLPWLDVANYVLMPDGALESSSGGWELSGGAELVSENEPWHVNDWSDSLSLSLPSGSSATTPPLCITLLHPDLRFFAVNRGAPTTLLKVEAITRVLGADLVKPIGVLGAGNSWQPTVPLAFLDNLTAATPGTIAFRFTPVGSQSGWRIDDVYVDPFKER